MSYQVNLTKEERDLISEQLKILGKKHKNMADQDNQQLYTELTDEMRTKCRRNRIYHSHCKLNIDVLLDKLDKAMYVL